MVLKKRVSILTAVFLSVFLFASLSFSGMLFADTNLVTNSDFSSGGTGWYSDTSNGGTVTFHDGVAEVKSTIYEGSEIYLYQDISTNDKNLALKFDVQRLNKGSDSGAFIVVGFDLYLEGAGLGDGQNNYGNYSYNFPDDGTWYRDNVLTLADAWENEHPGVPIPDFDTVRIWFAVDYEGDAYFDNISATGLAPAPVSAPVPLTPHDWVLMDLNIIQLIDHYGATPEGFIKMLYDNILGRVPDDSGLNYWTEQLNSNVFSASQIVEHFIFSGELSDKVAAMSNEEFITFLYKSFLSRTPDTDGYNSWLSYMNSGISKLDTLRTFLDNAEWVNICNLFNVTP